jgi:hypothetical protein
MSGEAPESREAQPPGNLGASVGVRDLDSERSEIVTLS